VIQVEHITGESQLQQAFSIREKVFVQEQQVPAEEEYDEYESSSRHFLAMNAAGKPCGTARWRFTDRGIKLERFAVLPEYRSQKVGSALVQALLEDIQNHPSAQNKKLYLHSQVTAMGLYSKFGFKPVGEQFDECNIPHYTMEKI
jgi:predicted GNAT family N-acyltransferase